MTDTPAPVCEPYELDIRENLRQLRRDEMWIGMRTGNSPDASDRAELLAEHIIAHVEAMQTRERILIARVAELERAATPARTP